MKDVPNVVLWQGKGSRHDAAPLVQPHVVQVYNTGSLPIHI